MLDRKSKPRRAPMARMAPMAPMTPTAPLIMSLWRIAVPGVAD